MGKFSNHDKEAVYNSSFTYLVRLNAWIERAHIYSADDDNIFDAFMALEEWAAELDCVLDDEERKDLEVLRKSTKRNLLYLKNKKNADLQTLREYFRPFQLYLGRLTHEKGLLMKVENRYDPKKDTRI